LCKPNWNAQGFAHRFAFYVTRALRQAMLRVSFRLAPPFHHEVSRPPGEEDARCVQPTSATRTTCRVPVLVRSRLSPRLAPCGCFPDFGIQKALTEEVDVSRRPPSLRRIAFRHTFFLCPASSDFDVFRLGRGRFSSHGARCDQPLTLLSQLLLVSRFAEPSPSRSTLFLFSRGLESEAAAKITVTTFS
jgi:hypothetical protein